MLDRSQCLIRLIQAAGLEKQERFLQFNEFQPFSRGAFGGESATLYRSYDDISCFLCASYFPQARCVMPVDHKIFPHAWNKLEKSLVKFRSFPVIEIV